MKSLLSLLSLSSLLSLFESVESFGFIGFIESVEIIVDAESVILRVVKIENFVVYSFPPRINYLFEHLNLI